MKKLSMLFFSLLSMSVLANTSGEILQQKLNSLRTMSANFNQVIHAKHRVVSRSTGYMAMQRPGKFNWDTKSPMAQRVVADGQRIWIYDVDLEQVTVRKQRKGLGGPPALFLGGYTDTVMRDFNVTETKKGKLQSFDLRVKSGANSGKDSFQRVKMDFVGDALNGIELYDQLGQHTTVRFSNVKINPTLSVKLFYFKPPKGVDVVQQ